MVKIYDYPHQTYENQISVLKSMGLSDEKDNDIISVISIYGYNKLIFTSGVLKTFKLRGDIPDKTIRLDEIISIQQFDKKLRLLIFDFIETFETSFRLKFSYLFAHKFGENAYRDERLAQKRDNFYKNNQALNNEILRTSNSLIKISLDEYTLDSLPLNLVVETMSFGLLIKYFENIKDAAIRHEISRCYHLEIEVFESWLRHLNEIRNICAHHERIWNRNFIRIPITRRKSIVKQNEFNHNDRRIYNAVIILLYFAQVLQRDDFKRDLMSLLQSQNLLLPYMGFPSHWQTLETFQ